MLRRLYFILGLVCAFFVLAPVQTFACSGYPYFGVDDLPTMELLVRATVIEADDRGFNAVIRVEEYYKGEGPQLLTIVRYPVSLATGRLVRGYDTGCLYAGRGHTWRPGTQGYFGLPQQRRRHLHRCELGHGALLFLGWEDRIRRGTHRRICP